MSAFRSFASSRLLERDVQSGRRALQTLPADDDWADIIVLKSVFTHLVPPDVSHYLREMRRVLQSSGTALATAYVFDDIDQAVERRFPFEADGYRYARRGSPETGVAYPRGWLLQEVAAAGLEGTILRGFWRPQDERPIAYQDIIVARPVAG